MSRLSGLSDYSPTFNPYSPRERTFDTYSPRGEGSEEILYEDPEVDADIPEGAASLAFVFDETGSMQDDLDQVKVGATEILATTLARREKPLYNYVLVPFKDPGKLLLPQIYYYNAHNWGNI